MVGGEARVCRRCDYIDGGDVEYGGVDYDGGGCGIGWIGVELCVEYHWKFGEFFSLRKKYKRVYGVGVDDTCLAWGWIRTGW